MKLPARAQEWVIRRSVCQRSERFAQCVCELYGRSRGLSDQKRRGTGWSQTRSVDGCSRPRHTQQKQHHKASAASCKWTPLNPSFKSRVNGASIGSRKRRSSCSWPRNSRKRLRYCSKRMLPVTPVMVMVLVMAVSGRCRRRDSSTSRSERRCSEIERRAFSVTWRLRRRQRVSRFTRL